MKNAPAERRAYAVVIGQLILHLRHSRRISQEALAAKAELSQSALSRFENGQTIPDAYELRALALALGYVPHQFTAQIDEALERTRGAAAKMRLAWSEIAPGMLAGLAIVGVSTMLDEVGRSAR